MAYLKLVLVMFFWSCAFISGRDLAPFYDALTISLIRFIISSIILFIVFFKDIKKHLDDILKNIPDIIFLGLSGIFLYNIFFFQGLQSVIAAKASVIIALNPSITILLSSVIFKEKLGAFKIAGVLMALTGVYIVISGGEGLNFQTVSRGEFFLLIAALCWSFYTLFSKRVLRKLPPGVLISSSCMVGAVFLLIAFLFNSHVDFSHFEFSHGVHFFIISVLATVIGFFLYSSAIRDIGPAKASIFINLVPVFSASLGILLLGEKINNSLILGGLSVITGVFLVNWKKITVDEK